MNFKEFESAEKLRGGYYTPSDLAQFLVKWVGGISPKTILEPSCGDGIFFEALCKLPKRPKVLGFELDEIEAEKAHKRATDLGLSKAKILSTDFLGWALDNIYNGAGQFDAIVGNPPFVRYQYLPPTFQERAEEIFQRLDCKFTKHTNAWVPFILASFELLKPGGRLAMVVPSEIIHVMHAQSLRTYLGEQAKRLIVIDPEEIWFEGTLQGAVLLLAETMNGKTVEGKWTRALLEPATRDLLDELVERNVARRFDDVAQVDVGIVTGANKFFLVEDETVKTFGLQKWAHPMFGRSEHCPGVIYDALQHKENAAKGKPTNFIWFPDRGVEATARGKNYIERGEKERLHTRYKCRIRKIWYSVPSVYATDVGMLKRSHDTPRLILNTLKAYTTDTSYRIRAKEGSASQLVYGFLNGLTALSAELEGRHYGGGVLELVPSEIEKLLIPPPSKIKPDIKNLDKSVRTMPMDSVLEKQTQHVLGGLGISKKDQAEILSGWKKLRNRRHRVSGDAA